MLILASGGAVWAAKSAGGSQLWIARYNGPAKSPEVLSVLTAVQSVAVSPDGATVFATGGSEGATSGLDYATVAYKAASGTRLWVARYNGPGNRADVPTSVAVSPDGTTVFVTGPSGGDTNTTGVDYATVAYNAATGAQLWVARYNGPANNDDGATSIAVDPRGGMVFVTGTSKGPAALTNDYATVAYDTATGAQLWVARYDGPASGNDQAWFIAATPDGTTVFVTGSSKGTTGLDYATVAYNTADGAQRWVARYDGVADGGDEARSVTVSPDGATVFVTGYSEGKQSGADYATIAYQASTGAQQWVTRYDGGGSNRKFPDFAESVAVSADGSKVFVSGSSATIAYKPANGAQLWLSRGAFVGTGGSPHPPTLAVSPDSAKVFVTGTSRGGPTTDYLTVAYNAATGARQWAKRYNGPLKRVDGARSLAVSPTGDAVFVHGISEGTNTGADYATIAYHP